MDESSKSLATSHTMYQSHSNDTPVQLNPQTTSTFATSTPNTCTSPSRTQNHNNADEVDEDISEEDVTDDELEAMHSNFKNGNAVTNQLLTFIKMVDNDIQKYFGKNSEDADSCEIYEEKWAKSGRERYYYDLLRVAQGLEQDDVAKQRKKETVQGSDSGASGRRNKAVGLGPLSDLFAQNTNSRSTRKPDFPASFWTEPRTNSQTVENKQPDFTDLLEQW